MNLYLFVYILLSILTLIEIKYSKHSFIIFIFFLLFFFLLGSLRWNTGTDWDPYYLYYITNDTKDNFIYDGKDFEKGYILLNYGIKEISNSYSVFLSICTFLNLVCFYYFTRSIFKTRYIFILLLYFAIFQGGIFTTRQLLATSICLLSTIFIIKRRVIPFFTCIIAASLLHITSIVYIAAYFIYNYKLSIKKFILFLGITILCSFSLKYILGDFISLINDPRLSGKLITYTDNNEAFGIVNLLKGIAKRIIILPLFFYIKEKHNKSNLYSGLFNIYLVGTLLYFLFSFADLAIFIRISTYFQLMEIPLLYLSYMSYKRKWLMIFIILFGLMKIVSFYSGYYDLYVPFNTIFSS